MKTFKITFVLAMLVSLDLAAQPAPPSSDNPAPLPGLIILAAAGAAVGAKKVYDQKKES